MQRCPRHGDRLHEEHHVHRVQRAGSQSDVNKWKTIEQADQSGVRFIEAEGAAQIKC
jgi:hypothetical protein